MCGGQFKRPVQTDNLDRQTQSTAFLDFRLCQWLRRQCHCTPPCWTAEWRRRRPTHPSVRTSARAFIRFLADACSARPRIKATPLGRLACDLGLNPRLQHELFQRNLVCISGRKRALAALILSVQNLTEQRHCASDCFARFAFAITAWFKIRTLFVSALVLLILCLLLFALLGFLCYRRPFHLLARLQSDSIFKPGDRCGWQGIRHALAHH